MKKKILITLTVLFSFAVAALFTITNIYSVKDKLLIENAAALAQLPVIDETDKDPNAGGSGVKATCANILTEATCGFSCSCGQEYVAKSGRYGPISNINGQCVSCGTTTF